MQWERILPPEKICRPVRRGSEAKTFHQGQLTINIATILLSLVEMVGANGEHKGSIIA
jgi:hypothetical protein